MGALNLQCQEKQEDNRALRLARICSTFVAKRKMRKVSSDDTPQPIRMVQLGYDGDTAFRRHADTPVRGIKWPK